MKERPILFSGPMVRALLEGRKTQTRRLVQERGYASYDGDEDHDGWPMADSLFSGCQCRLPARYGVAGDRLWVRETWGPCAGSVVYRADDVGGHVACPDGGKWRPSIHMPRWASRLTLDVEAVRVERLQDITEEDAQAEGMDWASVSEER